VLEFGHNDRGAAPALAEMARRLTGIELPIGLLAWDGSVAGPVEGPRLVVRSRRTLRRLLWDPSELGLARAFVSGDLDIEGDLTDALRRCLTAAGRKHARRSRLSPAEWAGAIGAAARLGVLGPRPRPPAAEVRTTGLLHSLRRDRAVIAHHYDLGNDFYELVLDPAMAYSCAYFAGPDQPLAEAQRAKLDLICRKLDLQPGQRLLDVGCGWGALILHAAQHYGVHATGITLSREQAEFVQHRIDQRALAEQAQVRLCDYREFTERGFDAVASIEMGEHVGAENYPRYAAMLHDALRPQGRLLLQQMSHGPNAPGGGAFIESYITPDMTMTPIGTTLGHLEAAGFEVSDVHMLREHYVHTIRAWERTFTENIDRLHAIAGAEQVRVWRLYLAGVALTFESNRMGVNQILASNTATDGESAMPLRRHA
jgi:cyclopropane-fatty-acyl-phospholipid synthase